MGECTCHYYEDGSLNYLGCGEAVRLEHPELMAHAVQAVRRLDAERAGAPSDEENFVLDAQDILAGWTSPANKAQCDCATKSPTYPVFREHLHVAPCPWFYVDGLVRIVERQKRISLSGAPSDEEVEARRLPAVAAGLLRRLASIDPIVPSQRGDWHTGPFYYWRCVFCGTWSDVREHVSHMSSCPWLEGQRIGAAVPAPEPPVIVWPSGAEEAFNEFEVAERVPTTMREWCRFSWLACEKWLRERIEAQRQPAEEVDPEHERFLEWWHDVAKMNHWDESAKEVGWAIWKAGKAAKEQAGS